MFEVSFAYHKRLRKMYFVVYKFDFFHYKNFLFCLFYRDNCVKYTILSSLKSTIFIKPLLVGKLDTFFGTLHDHFLQVLLYLFLTWQKLIMTKGSCNICISRIHQLQEVRKICNLEKSQKSLSSYSRSYCPDKCHTNFIPSRNLTKS